MQKAAGVVLRILLVIVGGLQASQLGRRAPAHTRWRVSQARKNAANAAALRKAIQDEDVPRVAALLAAGVSPNTLINESFSEYFCDQCRLRISVCDCSKHMNVEHYFERPLGAAAALNNIRLVSLLLSFGADVNGTDARGDTALHALASGYKRSSESFNQKDAEV